MSNTPVNHQPITRPQGGNDVGFQYSGLPSDQMNTSVVSIEQQRAIAEAQGQLILAKKFPRNFNKAMEDILNSCSYFDFAEEAFYALPRGGQTIRGPSIRLAEEIARCYGNFQYGHRELARNEGESVLEVFAWDMENNNRSTRQITVPHIMDTKQGGKKLTGQKEIADYIANVASKQMRSRIMALLPKPLVAAAIKRCEQTLAGTAEQTIQQRVDKMMTSFAKYGVTVKMLEAFLKHSLSDTTADELTDLIAVFSAIKDGSPAKEFFTVSDNPVDDESTQNVKGIIERNAAAAAAAKGVNTQPNGETLTKPAATTPAQRPEDQPQEESQEEKPAPTPAKPKKNTATGKKADPKPAQQQEPENKGGEPPVTEQEQPAEEPEPEATQQSQQQTTEPAPQQQEPAPEIEEPVLDEPNLTPPSGNEPPPPNDDDFF